MIDALTGKPLDPLASLDLEPGLVDRQGKRTLTLVAPAGWAGLADFDGEFIPHAGKSMLVGPLTARNAAALRRYIPWLRPRLLGLQRSAGLGDRLGLATPGHVRAVRAVGGLAPIFAQQSIREMQRSGRSAQQVQDDALWGVLAEGWRAGFGADADHLKSYADIDTCAAAGYTFFTIDPGAHVDAAAETESLARLQEKAEAIDWALLESSPVDMLSRYAGKTVSLERSALTFDAPMLWRAMVKYVPALAHIVRMERYLRSKAIPFELEISVDETETPTTHTEHYWMARELQRLGVQWVSLAPRFVGRFEKGVEYQGNLDLLKTDLEGHAEIARCLGPYKLSLHSGSDKFSVYPLLAEATGGVAHIKTAGTSYLEALRVIAACEPDLFRQIYGLACQHYETDRASYHVSARLEHLPNMRALPVEDLPDLLDQFDARQVLHVTFGTVLAQLREPLLAALQAHAAAYTADLQRHFEHHLRPFVGAK